MRVYRVKKTRCQIKLITSGVKVLDLMEQKIKFPRISY